MPPQDDTRSRLFSLSLPPHATTLHLLTYLLGLALSAVSIFVFLNSTISFVVTDILGIGRDDPEHHHKNVLGDIVGTLGFIDEITIILSAPVWGVLSDKWEGSQWGGRRGVTGLGYIIVAIGLVGLSAAGIVRGRNGDGKGIQLEGREWWYWLVFWRVVYAIGAGAVSTMVSAVLTDLTTPVPSDQSENTIIESGNAPADERSEEATVSSPVSSAGMDASSSSSKLAGIVGFFSGLGALFALAVFLPLPTLLDPTRHDKQPHEPGDSPATTGTGQGLKRTYWIVSGYALVCSLACWIGLPHGSRSFHGFKSRIRLTEQIKNLWYKAVHRGHSRTKHNSHADVDEEQQPLLANNTDNLTTAPSKPQPFRMFLRSASLLFTAFPTIGIAYFGSFIARASSVSLSLFIPLFVNHYFIAHNLCNPDSYPSDKESMKRECRRAYILAAQLTGTSQFVAVLAAPIIGQLSVSPSKPAEQPGNATAQRPLKVLSITSTLGAVGFVGFGLLSNPEISAFSLLFCSLIGIGQIGAVVGSLGLLGRGISLYSTSPAPPPSPSEQRARNDTSVTNLKGSIAGVYSLYGGLGIALLTKVGGLLFDNWNSGAPFWVLGIVMGCLGITAGWLGWAAEAY